VEGHCLDALADFAVTRGLPTAPECVDDLESFASRRNLRELVTRAALLRARLGQPGASESVAPMLEALDNPALTMTRSS
jgi:hypothetical protein